MTALTLDDIQNLAERYTPRAARWDYLVEIVDYWGPAHELAHAILSRPEERMLVNYGMCDAGECKCRGERCHVVELAAQRISGHLLTVAGRHDLAIEDVDATDNYDVVCTPENWRASWRMLRVEHLWPLPRTRAGLERLLSRRIG